MATGKSTVGKLLAEKLQRQFIEMDELIEQKENRKITDIFAAKGEAYFRKLETTLLAEIALKQNFVVSCGGGLICNEANLKTLKKSGTIVNLNASSRTIYERAKQCANRPLLNVADPQKKIIDLLKIREYYYNQADFKINTENKSPSSIVDEIINRKNAIEKAKP
jgi:shikimate kinase